MIDTLKPEVVRGVRLFLRKSVIGLLLPPACLFISAGRLDWPMGWAFVGMMVSFGLTTVAVLLRRSPDLLAERSRIQKGTKPWDKVILPAAAFLLPNVTWIVSGLDTRFGWSPPFPAVIAIGASAAFVLGGLLMLWAITSNRFFSATVRIQADRGHTVVSAGPYAHVRHPGYMGWLITVGAAPVILGSLWALFPAAVTFALVILRTALEDRTLQNELEGYREYAVRVRWRLLPGIW